jgi:uncharacterized Zn finger protein (UPF0148 family)
MGSPAGHCPDCGLLWRDHEPGDWLRCPKCETTVTLVFGDEVGGDD